MSLLRCFPVLAVLIAPFLATAQPLALQPGERLKFRVTWGILKAGEVEIAADATGEPSDPLTEVVVHTASAGLIRRLYSFDGEVRSLFDPDSGQLISASATTRSKKKSTDASITLDHRAAEAAYVDNLDPSRSTTVPLPESRPMDLVTSLVEARAWSLRPGDKRQIAVLFDDEFYDLTLKAVRYETVKTDDGKRRALLVVPRMEEKPRGLFKRGGEIRVWLDHEPPHLPLRFEVKTRAGTAVAVLTDYRPPTTIASVAEPSRAPRL